MKTRAWLLVVAGCVATVAACEVEEHSLGSGPTAGEAGEDSASRGGQRPAGGSNTGGAGPLPERGGTVGSSGGRAPTNGGSGGSGGAMSDVCGLPMYVAAATGGCAASFPSFWHNPELGKCEPFFYGGCNGTANRFETLAACEAACDDDSSIDCEAIDVVDGTARVSLAQFCEFLDDHEPCPRTYDEAFEQLVPADCGEGNTSFQLREGCGLRVLEDLYGLSGYSFSFDAAGTLVGASSSSDTWTGPCGDRGVFGYVAGDHPIACEQTTTCQPCADTRGDPLAADPECADSGVDCHSGEMTLAGFCANFEEFFPGVSDECPTTLDEAKALFEPRCSEPDAVDIEYNSGCGFELIHLQFSDQRYSTLTFQDGALTGASVSTGESLGDQRFGPCDGFSGYRAGSDAPRCDDWARCSRCSQTPPELEVCPVSD
jgi:hypothetical protein